MNQVDEARLTGEWSTCNWIDLEWTLVTVFVLLGLNVWMGASRLWDTVTRLSPSVTSNFHFVQDTLQRGIRYQVQRLSSIIHALDVLMEAEASYL